MLNNQWSKPVEVGFGVAGYRVVNGPFEALIVLQDMWPHRSGAHFIKARNACRAAIEGRVNPERARDEFIAAAEEAKLSTH
ncbi:DUF982 domain-containing protein [Rhizobium sp. 1399]|uniref:DUF982 domain-containing protein n=1 Tax=Rhizobium sp. 1399 TaxID=2817758 RepID=UPI00285C6C77|nr:DUF982 domain-containing protein [Rhizobium sp. 1399]MDR6670171.1 hypothetical protein [Rhizobium sp. 1399]